MMERLTSKTRNFDGTGFAMKSLVNDNGKLTDFTDKVLTKLAEYEDAEEQGLLLRLPIAEDTAVYSIEYCCGKDKNNKSGMCHMGFCENCDDKGYYIKKGIAKQCSITEINKTVFLTREEAEKALEDMKGKV